MEARVAESATPRAAISSTIASRKARNRFSCAGKALEKNTVADNTAQVNVIRLVLITVWPGSTVIMVLSAVSGCCQGFRGSVPSVQAANLHPPTLKATASSGFVSLRVDERAS